MAKKELPSYSHGEELFNAITHIVGAAFGIVVLVLCVVFASYNQKGNEAILSCVIYGLSVIVLYTMSSLYHFLSPRLTAKRVFRVFDHCTIFLLIAGTYTPICVIGLGIGTLSPDWGLILLLLVWIIAAIGITFNAINMYWKPVKILSQCMYLVVGWAIVMALNPLIDCMTMPGFILMIAGGVSYTIGAVLYGIGKKKKWMHSIFHIFVLIGTILQFISIFVYLLL